MTIPLAGFGFDGTWWNMGRKRTSTPPPPPPPPPPGGIEAGAKPIGEAVYAVPPGAIYLSLTTNSPAGNDANNGLSAAAPKATLQAAVTACPAGGTVVVRGGVYEQKYTGTLTKSITIQNYSSPLGVPEPVYFDGSKQRTSWTNNGDGTWTGALFFQPDRTLPEDYRGGVEQTFPMASWPDMVHINGVRQQHRPGTGIVWWDTSPAGDHSTDIARPVAPETPGPGEFVINVAAATVTIGTDPTGKEVRLSNLDKFLVARNPAIGLKGIGIRRYATTLTSSAASVDIGSPDPLVENVLIEDCGQQSFSFRSQTTGGGIYYSTIRRSSQLGFHGGTCSNTAVNNCLVEDNNFNMWQNEPGAGGLKTSRIRNCDFRNNVIRNNNSAGLWFDVSVYDVRCVNNLFYGNRGPAFEFEISRRCIFANNRHTGGSSSGYWALDSGEVRLWNNIVNRATSFDLRFEEDNRAGVVSPGENPDGLQDWRTDHVEVCNNVLANYNNAAGVWRLFFANIALNNENTSAYFDRIAGNVWSGTSTTSVSRMASVEDASGVQQVYTTPAAFQAAMPAGKVGTNRIEVFTAPTQAMMDSWASIADPMPADIAALLGVPTGTKKVGPILPAPVPRT